MFCSAFIDHYKYYVEVDLTIYTTQSLKVESIEMFCKAMEMYTVIQIVIAFACAMPAVSKSIYSNETHDDIRKFPLTSMKITGNVNTLQAHKGYRQVSLMKN